MTRKRAEMLWQMFLARLASPILSEADADQMSQAVQEILSYLTDTEVPIQDDAEKSEALALMKAAGLKPVRFI